ncbi:MAG: hypothetical protein ABFS41_03835 [Myxococcota bacterium]
MNAIRLLLALGISLAGVASAAADGQSLVPERTVVEGPASARILVVEAPEVSGDAYAIRGRVAYEDVQGDAYLEMWSEFPDGSRYFSRTLETAGPLARLRGSSPARDFALPFFLTPGSPQPTRLEVSVVLPGPGRVRVSDLAWDGDLGAGAATRAWWSPAAGSWVGALAGSAVGVLGAAIGTLCSLGRGRRFVMAGLLAMGVGGFVALTAGLLALALGQPYAVWYPLLLLGGLTPALALTLRPTARRRFEALELRRMQALDVG